MVSEIKGGVNKLDTASYQEQALRAAASISGSLADLICYFGIRRDRSALDAVAAELVPDDFLGRLYYDLITLEQMPSLAEGMLERLPCQEAAWPWLAFTKFFLSRHQLTDALQTAITRLQSSNRDLAPLNLVARYLLVQKEYDTAQQVIEHSLRLGPAQTDIVRLRERALAHKPWQIPLMLDPLPRCNAVSFYIPAYNVEKYMADALDGLFRMNYPLHEVIVVDDGCQDASIEIARRYPVRIVSHAENRGLAAARNSAFQAADGTYVGAIDTDAVPEPDYLLHAMLEFENACENLAGVGGKLIEHYATTPADKWRALTLAQHRGSVRQYGEVGLFGSNTVFLRDAVLSVGGYDERRRTNGEDHALCNALTVHGYAQAYTPHAIANHYRRDTIESVLRTLWNWNYWGWKESGAYAARPKLWEKLRIAWGKTCECLDDDFKENRDDIAYIDLLMFFDTVHRDTACAAADYLLTTAEACLIVRGLLDFITELDAPRSGQLAAKIRAHVESIKPVLDPSTRIRPEVQSEIVSWIDGLRPAITDLFRQWSLETYHTLLDTQ